MASTWISGDEADCKKRARMWLGLQVDIFLIDVEFRPLSTSK